MDYTQQEIDDVVERMLQFGEPGLHCEFREYPERGVLLGLGTALLVWSALFGLGWYLRIWRWL